MSSCKKSYDNNVSKVKIFFCENLLNYSSLAALYIFFENLILLNHNINLTEFNVFFPKRF